MVANNFFAHNSFDGSTFDTRIKAAGYPPSYDILGENIAAGQVGIDAVMTAWINSPDHCANIMNPRFADVGLVCVPGTASTTYQTYWTMDLGHVP
jgi:uncharacterized protein YkwD